ncbi:alpha-hydroxy-acid oxidizing protein [soil metagenome]
MLAPCYHERMSQRDFAALESYQLIPRLLHGVEQADTGTEILGTPCAAPLLPLFASSLGRAPQALEGLSLVAAELAPGLEPAQVVPLVRSQKMGVLMPQVRKLRSLGVPAVALDLTALAETPPYGRGEWRPRTKEDLAELRAAAGVPFWLYGVGSPADAEIAMEAGLEAIVVHTGAGLKLGSPATIEIFPDIFDAVAGMVAVYAGGAVRDGIDVFRYLAVGAEAVVVENDRPLAQLTAELEYAMRLTGCQTVADIGYETIFAPLFGEI